MLARSLASSLRPGRPPAAILVVTAIAWALAVGAEASGRASLLGHGHLLEGGTPVVAAVALFVASWQVMVAAMMLPSSLGMLGAFRRLADAGPNSARARVAFLGAYVCVWTAFGLIAFGSDAVLHRVVDASAWLREHEWVIGGVVLIGAGAFQFSRFKDRCLSECRTPVGFLVERYRPGARAAFGLGVSHGVFCVGCCWALMLVAFAAGAGNLLWMAVLTTVMVLERSVSWGASIVRPVGAWFIVLGALVLLQPAGFPPALGPG